MLNLIQHLTKSMSYETLKSQTLNLIQGMVQGDKSGLFTNPPYFTVCFLSTLESSHGRILTESLKYD